MNKLMVRFSFLIGNEAVINMVKNATVKGVGIIGNKYPITINKVMVKEYDLWKSMLLRCYSKKHQEKHHAYIGCIVSENFKYYEFFYEWCQNQVGFKDGFHLDKDLLVKGNKVYSEDTCVFLPREINNVLTSRNSLRGKYLLGVCFHKCSGKFIAQINSNGIKRKHLGTFNTEIEAFNAYKQAKESYLKELANKWKGKIDDRAYNALMNYTVEITD